MGKIIKNKIEYAGGGGGGSDINVVQTTGQSTTDVMSQKAVTDTLAETIAPLDSAVREALTLADTANDYANAAFAGLNGKQDELVSGMNIKTVNNKSLLGEGNVDIGVPIVVQTTGESTADVMSQKAVTDAIAGVTPPTVVQTIGQSTTNVMSQKATTDMIYLAGDQSNSVCIGQGHTIPASSSPSMTVVGQAITPHGGDVILGGSNTSSKSEGSSSTHNYNVLLGTSLSATGASNVIIGRSNVASYSGSDNLSNAIIIGVGSSANGLYNTCIGNRASTSGTWSTAIGPEAKTLESQAIAIGYEAEAAGTKSIAIGPGASGDRDGGIAIGNAAQAYGGVAIGFNSKNNNFLRSVALGSGAENTRNDEVNIKSSSRNRVIGGVANGTNLDDAATVAQGNKLMTSAPTTTSQGVLGQLWTDTRAGQMHTYQCTAIDITDPDNPVYTWTQRW